MSSTIVVILSIAAGLITNRAVDVWLPELTYRVSIAAGLLAGAAMYMFGSKVVLRFFQQRMRDAVAASTNLASSSIVPKMSYIAGDSVDAMFADMPLLTDARSCSNRSNDSDQKQQTCSTPASTPFSYIFDGISPQAALPSNPTVWVPRNCNSKTAA